MQEEHGGPLSLLRSRRCVGPLHADAVDGAAVQQRGLLLLEEEAAIT